jgi:hypothetical protein
MRILKTEKIMWAIKQNTCFGHSVNQNAVGCFGGKSVWGNHVTILTSYVLDVVSAAMHMM